MSPEQRPSQEVLWARLEGARRGREPSLTHDRIAASAVALADAGGIDAVSMRKVAGDLGVGTMSLYRYVRTKHELLELMVDRVMGELSLEGERTPGWREVLTLAARQMRQMMLRHPWALANGLGARTTVGPNTLRWVEESTACLDQPGLSIDQVMDMSGTVTAFAIGSVQYELGEQEARRVTGLTDQEWREQMGPYVRQVIARGQHPYFERIVVEAEDFPSPDETFERRLGYVLDGLAAGLGLE